MYVSGIKVYQPTKQETRKGKEGEPQNKNTISTSKDR